MSKIDEECWDCICLDADLDTKKIYCEKGFNYENKPKLQIFCPGYEWDEVNDHPWFWKGEKE